MIEAGRYSDYKTRTLDEVREALDKVPARKAGTGTYHIYRNLFWGLIKAVEEAGSTRDQAISLMQAQLTLLEGTSADRNSGGEKVTAGTFWYWAKHFGWRPPAPPQKPELNITAVAEALDAGEFEPTGEKLQKIEADQLIQHCGLPRRNTVTTSSLSRLSRKKRSSRASSAYYLKLAQMRLKISKEVAIDCVVEVAKENSYDPVKAYLEHCSSQSSPPTSTDSPAPTSDRQDATIQNQPSTTRCSNAP